MTYYNPDQLYVLIKQPPEPHTVKVVIGWRDHQEDQIHYDQGR
jgi:hypothetical protein